MNGSSTKPAEHFLILRLRLFVVSIFDVRILPKEAFVRSNTSRRCSFEANGARLGPLSNIPKELAFYCETNRPWLELFEVRSLRATRASSSQTPRHTSGVPVHSTRLLLRSCSSTTHQKTSRLPKGWACKLACSNRAAHYCGFLPNVACSPLQTKRGP